MALSLSQWDTSNLAQTPAFIRRHRQSAFVAFWHYAKQQVQISPSEMAHFCSKRGRRLIREDVLARTQKSCESDATTRLLTGTSRHGIPMLFRRGRARKRREKKRKKESTWCRAGEEKQRFLDYMLLMTDSAVSRLLGCERQGNIWGAGCRLWSEVFFFGRNTNWKTAFFFRHVMSNLGIFPQIRLLSHSDTDAWMTLALMIVLGCFLSLKNFNSKITDQNLLMRGGDGVRSLSSDQISESQVPRRCAATRSKSSTVSVTLSLTE